MTIDYAARTDVGRHRSENQDNVLAGEAALPGCYVFAVADGVGGLAGGAAASLAAVTALGAAIRRDGTPDLAAGVLEANAEILRKTDGDRPSGSTMTAMLVQSGTFEIAHVGDSRAYLLRHGSLVQLTNDHSLVAEQVRAGVLTEEAARSSKIRNVITRSLGIEDDLDVDRRGPEPIAAGDVFLISSDGLHGLVTDAELATALGRPDSAETIAAGLIDQANARGGTDNISAIVVRVIEIPVDGRA